MLDVKAIAYGNDKFVGVSMNDGSRICISSNAVDWRIIETENKNRLYDIAFGNGRFVAVGLPNWLDSTPVVVSSNGVDWTGVTNESLSACQTITYGNGQFVATGFGSDILTSTDGLEWFNHHPVVAQKFVDLHRIVFENAEFFAMGRYLSVPPQPQRNGLLRSKDGTNWVEVTGVATAPTHLSFGNGLFVGINTYGAVVTSEDATIWKELPQHYGYALTSCSYHDGAFYVFGTAGRILEASILPSLDVSWAGQENQPILGLSGVAGKTYGVDYAVSLNNGPAWTRMTNITLESTRRMLRDTCSSNAPKRFYRAVEIR